jgi:hypothetical protein
LYPYKITSNRLREGEEICYQAWRYCFTSNNNEGENSGGAMVTGQMLVKGDDAGIAVGIIWWSMMELLVVNSGCWNEGRKKGKENSGGY